MLDTTRYRHNFGDADMINRMLPSALAMVLCLVVRVGHTQDVFPPRIDTNIQLDGHLDEAVWAEAALLDGFWQYQPVDGLRSVEPTEVRVWYAPNAIYFGIRAYEIHGEVVRVTKANRDNISSDDYVQILLDTNNDNRIAFLFGSNPLGVQQDGTRADQSGGGAGGRSATGGGTRTINFLDGNIDLNPDYQYETSGVMLADGYSIEMRIPFKSLRYQPEATQDWGIHVLRRVQHSGVEDSWAPAVRANASFLSQSGTLRNLTDLRRGLVLDVSPTVTARLDGSAQSDGTWGYGSEGQFGADVKWGIRQNLTLNATANPDFSQVEADVGQVVLNERFALFFPEKRPFFLDGLELFDTPGQMIYTRRIVDPIVGAKVGGKVGKTNIGAIVAADATSMSQSGDEYPLFGVVRLRRDLPGNSTIGAVLTSREEGTAYSRLAGVDLRLIHHQKYFVELQGVHSATPETSGSYLSAMWDRTGRNWGFNYSVKAISDDFEAAAGFVNRTGYMEGRFFNRLTGYGEPDDILQTYQAFFGFGHIWSYGALTDQAIEGSFLISPSVTLQGGWRFSGRFSTAFYSYIPADYAAYTVDGSAFDVPSQERRQHTGNMSVTTPTFRFFTATVSQAWGRTPLFAEAAPGSSRRFDATVDIRPTPSLRTSLQWTQLSLARTRDGSLYSQEFIPRVKVEYQVTPAIFVRLIGQYADRTRRALVDRRGRPIAINGIEAARSDAQGATIDWLFSYRPTPGTLVYVGYGTAMDDVGQQRFRSFERQFDGFFAKLSYRFSV